MRPIYARLFALGLLTLIPAPLAAETMAEMTPDYVTWLDPSLHDAYGKLEIRRGTVEVPGGVYDLNLGDKYYAVTGPDAAWVLGTLWQNLPDPAIGAIVFQNGTSPIDESWALAVAYYADGHISDQEADEMDYDAIIQYRKDGDAAANQERLAAGLPEMETIGLTGTPGYDKASRTLHFSVLLRFMADGSEVLNANTWVLSRHGFVLMNVLGSADQAAEVDAAMPDLIRLVTLREGHRYEDFVPGIDTVADGGLSALLGGGWRRRGCWCCCWPF